MIELILLSIFHESGRATVRNRDRKPATGATGTELKASYEREFESHLSHNEKRKRRRSNHRAVGGREVAASSHSHRTSAGESWMGKVTEW